MPTQQEPSLSKALRKSKRVLWLGEKPLKWSVQTSWTDLMKAHFQITVSLVIIISYTWI